MKLLITESPSKASTIQKFLNEEFPDENFLVKSSKGHIYQLKKSGRLNLGIDLETFEPKWEIEPSHKKIVKELVELAKNANVIYYATDADREGETIAYTLHKEISSKLKSDKVKYFRIIFNEITKDAIIAAIKNPTTFSQSMINSQLTRRMLDRIIGFRLSRLLSLKINSRSAGRVQSIVLKMIVERFQEYKKFIREKYWLLSLLLENNFEIDFIGTKEKKYKIFPNLNQLLAVKNNLGKEVNLTEIIESNRIKNPPLPFVTATILRTAINQFGYTIQKTLFVLQVLYEGVKISDDLVGLITYPRTDSKRINLDFQKKIKSKIIETFGKDYVNDISFKTQPKLKNIQDAHEAIRVTNLELIPEKIKEFLSTEQFNIYKLIYNTCLTAFMKPSIYKNFELVFEINGYLFSKKIRLNTFFGFEIVNNQVKINSVNQKTQVLLDKFKKPKNIYPIIDFIEKEEETKPPSLLTESSIIDQLEKLGIGRPSTYNDAIFKTKQSNYIVKKNGHFFPSFRGLLTEENIEKYFSEFINYKFSCHLEQLLDEISKDEINYKNFLENFFKEFENKIQNCFKEMNYVPFIPLNIPCPSCKTGRLLIKTSKYGDFIACSNYPECKYTSKDKSLLFPVINDQKNSENKN